MAKSRSNTRNQSHDDVSSTESIKNCNKGDMVPWSDLNHDVLHDVMLRLGFLDFFAFSSVCKSWRAFALPNWKKFMTSRPPMLVWFANNIYTKECYLESFETRRFKTNLPHSSNGWTCVGLTCGYLIFYVEEMHAFWLVNPITRHRLLFPGFPDVYEVFFHVDNPRSLTCTLVFSPSIFGWLFVITKRCSQKVWFSLAGKGVWNHVSTTSNILDLHTFKGKIYTLNIDYRLEGVSLGHLCEMRLGPEPELMILKTANFPKIHLFSKLVNTDENLCVLQANMPDELFEVHELDFGEMKWVCGEKTKKECTFYVSEMIDKTTAVKRESWDGTEKSGEGRYSAAPYMWYFPHDCFHINLID